MPTGTIPSAARADASLNAATTRCAAARDLEVRARAITSGEELATMAEAWNALAGEIPFRRHEWLEPWWRHFAGRGDRLLTLAAYDGDGELIGLAPWYRHASPWEGRVLRFLGSGDVCSDYVGLLAKPGWEDVVVDRLARWVIDNNVRVWDAIQLEGAPADDPLIERFTIRLVQCGAKVSSGPPLQSWRIPLPGTWEEYVQRLSKSRRERVRQICRRQFATGRVTVRRTRDRAELERDFDVLVGLHQKRRGTLQQSGCFASAQFTAFLCEAAGQFLDTGRLALQITSIDDCPVAAEIDFLGGDTVYYYQSGIDPEREEERPGWLGTIASVQHAIEEDYRFFDLMRGDEPYKQQWRAEPRRLTDIRLAAPTARGHAYHHLHEVKAQAKVCVKRWIGHTAATNGALPAKDHSES